MPTILPTEPIPDEPMELEQGSSLWRDAWHRLSKNKIAVFGGVTLIVLTIACIFGPLLSSYSYEDQNLNLGASAPSMSHWLGTDTLGRDLLVRLLVGGRISIGVGLCATLVALTIGVVYGATAGFFADSKISIKWMAILSGVAGVFISIILCFFVFHQWSFGLVFKSGLIALTGGALMGAVLKKIGVTVDELMMRIVDIMYALPFTIFVILLMVFFGRNIVLLFVAIGAVEWLTMARIVRGQIMSIKKMEFIEAARSIGLGKSRIIFRHMIPNVLGPIIVYTTLTIPAVMLLEAFLSFLGLGVQPPLSSWGVLIKDGAEKMEEFWWLLVFPGTIFSLTLFSLNFLGDGLRDALDVRSSKD